ncbi:DUF1622 domain-containing protein [Planctomonas psychrotolerans]|uniref:DUF1622 domain-containing protein n=1 Tax=Planctomonas psychrotolerans TaxID=2528712 RepID=UPI001238A741|nr:DUF1622 domain-containing protein [Planctomonas psychrotolerans]
MEFSEIMETVGKGVDAVGVIVIVVGAILATVVALAQLARGKGPVYRPYRRQLGRTILLGLEFLVAADIIRTVAVTPTFESVGVLAIIVLIRTFLSFSLELEITGKWPWQKGTDADGMAAAPPTGEGSSAEASAEAGSGAHPAR